MHNMAFRELGLDFVYIAFEVKEENLNQAIKGIRSLGLVGLNVTIPYKEKVIQFLDEISPEASDIGAVNTILNRQDRLVGYNTDGLGAIKALEENNIELNGKRILLLGAGGAARSIAFYFSKNASELLILNRNTNRAKNLAEVLQKKYQENVRWNKLSKETIKNKIDRTDILINATSVGMDSKSNDTLIDPTWLNSKMCVFDIVYSPIGTKLIRDAKTIGAKTIDGIDMLIYQGAIAFKIWTGKEAPIDIMKNAIMNEISEFRN